MLICCGVNYCHGCSPAACTQCSVAESVSAPNVALRKMVKAYKEFNTSLRALQKSRASNQIILIEELPKHFKWSISRSNKMTTEHFCVILETVATAVLIPDNHTVDYSKALKAAFGKEFSGFISVTLKSADAAHSTNFTLGDGLNYVAVETPRVRITLVFPI